MLRSRGDVVQICGWWRGYWLRCWRSAREAKGVALEIHLGTIEVIPKFQRYEIEMNGLKEVWRYTGVKGDRCMYQSIIVVALTRYDITRYDLGLSK